MFADNKKILLDIYQQERLPKHWLDTLYAEGLFKLFVPRIYGGLECNLKAGLTRIYETAAIHGSLGWVVNLGAGAGYFWSFFDHDTAEEIFTPEDAVIAGSGQTSGTISNNLVNGAWTKSTGAAHASWFTANARLENGEFTSFAIPRDKVNIYPSWNLFALKATSSFAVEVIDEYIEDRYLFTIGNIRNTASTYAIRYLSFEPFARFCMLSALLGMTGCLVRHLENEFAHDNRIIHFSNRLEQNIKSFKNELFTKAEQFYQAPGNQTDLAVGEISKRLYRECTNLFYYHGMQIGNEEYLSHYAWRDVMLATQHFLLK